MTQHSQAKATPQARSVLAARRAKTVLIASVLITVALYIVPFGTLIAYPLMLLSTLVHELGHGLTAIVVGGTFEQFAMYADGSGVARYSGDLSASRHGLIAAGGLLGPSVGAAIGFGAGRSLRVSRVLLVINALALCVIAVLLVRNPFGWVFMGALALGLGMVAFVWPKHAQFVVVFFAVQLALSVFSRSDYLFTDSATTSVGTLPSDVAQIANAWGGPYWLWGIVCGVFSLVVVVTGIRLYLSALDTARSRT